MRRKVGIVVGVCAALVLTGSSGVVAWRQVNDENGRPVGTWHEAPGAARTAVDLLEGATTEKSAAASQGRQKVGERFRSTSVWGTRRRPSATRARRM